MTESFQAFLDDVWRRSFDCVAWFYTFPEHTPSTGFSEPQIEGLEQLYDRIVVYLRSSTKIQTADGGSLTPNVTFHEKFGWTLEAAGTRAFLGKVDCPDLTPMEIGRMSYLSGHSTIRGAGTLKIGAFTSIGEGLYLNTSDDSHPFEYPALINFSSEQRCREYGFQLPIEHVPPDRSRNGITIGSDVWIGRNARIFHGVEIADGCVIAEGSLVRESTEAYGVYAGSPARLKRRRFSDQVIQELQSLQWWNWPLAKIIENETFFATNLVSSTRSR